MLALAATLRFLQLFAHAAHHMAFGCTFNQDHEFFGELYEAYTEAFDDLTERLIGLGTLVSVADRLALDAKANDILSRADTAELTCPEDWFEVILETEQEVCAKIEKLAAGKISQGTMNLLAQFADDSEKRQYKLSRRVMPDEDDAAEGETSEDDGDEIKRAY